MKISSNTLEVLKNFSSINNSLRVKPGNVINTSDRGNGTTIVAEAKIEDEFPQEFRVYDLMQFFNTIRMLPEAHLEFENDKLVKIRSEDNTQEFRYQLASPEIVDNAKKINDSSVNYVISFEMSHETLSKLNKAANVGNLDTLFVESDGNEVKLVLRNVETGMKNEFSVKVSKGDGTKYSMAIKVDQLNKIIPGDYDVQIDNVKLSKLSNKDYDLTYWILLDKKHTNYEG